MPRYIDADVLRDRFQSLAYDDWNQGAGTTWANAFSEAADIVDDAPTADLVEVVRCKDCKSYLHSSEICGIIDTRLHFYETDKTWADDCFCSWGERKETEDGCCMQK